MKNRIETKTSRTAELTCSCRAAAYFEKDPCLKTDDYIAPQILPLWLIPLVKLGFIRKIFMNKFAPRGIYEYVIGRTKYIDEITGKALENDFDQILLLGAGFDSRAIRFDKINRKTTFFEMDAEITQKAKIDQFKRRKISIPEKCKFIPINFNLEKIEDKLNQSTFKLNKKTLFILEGLLMYLNEEAVNENFRVIKIFAGKGSWIVCDFIYKSVLKKENIHYGEKDIYEQVNKVGEAWKFGIEKQNIKSFFSNKGFSIKEIVHPELLKKKYFNNNNSYKINETHCITWLEV